MNALRDVKVLDPACGSGAYPISMMYELLRLNLRLDRRLDEYRTKFEIFKNNIYGVDIDPIAIEISRLRSFLSLVVDQEYNDKKINGGIESLPNLEFKFVCANTLVELSAEEGLYDGIS